MSVTSRRRRNLDRAIALAIATAVIVTGVILYLGSDIRAATSTTGSSQPIPSPPSSLPATLTELWRAPTDPTLGAVISPAGVVVTTTQHAITALDSESGEQRWSYQRDNRELCAVGSPDTSAESVTSGSGLRGITAVYRIGDFCSAVQNFKAITGDRGKVRTSPNQPDGELLFGGNVAGWWGPTLVEVWRNDLYQMVQYGVQPNPPNSGTQHLGCTFTDMALALDQFATIEHCPERGPNARVVLNFNDPGDKKKGDWDRFDFDPRADIDTGSPVAVVAGITVHRVLVLVTDPEPALVLYDAAGSEISRSTVDLTKEQITAAADGRPLPRLVTANALYAQVGDNILVMKQEGVTTTAPSTALTTPTTTSSTSGETPDAPPQVTVESLSLQYLVSGALGLPAEFDSRLLIPTADGLWDIDRATGPGTGDRTIPLDREGWVGPVEVGVIGSTIVEVRDDTVVAYD